MSTGQATVIESGVPFTDRAIEVSPSGRTLAWTVCGAAAGGCETRIAIEGAASARVSHFVAIAATDAYILGYPLAGLESSAPWSVYEIATGEIRPSQGPRNLAWDGYAISEFEFLVTESDAGGEPRLAVLDGRSMERRVVLELERRGSPQLLYFCRSARWAALAPLESLGDLVAQGSSVRVIDLATGEVAAKVVLGGEWSAR